MTYSWLRGEPINVIISNGIRFSKKVCEPSPYRWVDFDSSNSYHVNLKILEIINSIETDITFKLESALAHYYQLCKSLHGEDASGINLSKFVDYGTINAKEMSLQEYGFSRAAASELLKKYRVFVEFDSNDGLKRINVKGLLNSVGSGGLLKKEIEWLNI